MFTKEERNRMEDEKKYYIYYNRENEGCNYFRSFDSEEERDKVFDTIKKYQPKNGVINLRKER